MKAVIIFSALLALSFATYTTEWATCNRGPNDTYIQPVNVTLNYNQTDNRVTIHFCGKAKENILFSGNSLDTFINDSEYSLSGGSNSFSPAKPFNAGQDFCYDIIEFGFYNFQANYTFQVQLKDDKKSLNCLNATMIVQDGIHLFTAEELGRNRF